MIKKFFLAFAVTVLVAGCGSNVKLDDVPVEDRSASAVRPGTGGTPPPGPAAQSGVAPVDLSRSGQNGTGPAGTTNIVYFDYDSFVIKPEFQAVIETHAKYLSANKARKAMLEGHTDERGGREYNLALGQKRSEAVRRAFGLLGVTDAQIEAVSFGKEKPATTGTDEASFAKNRRAEIVYR